MVVVVSVGVDVRVGVSVGVCRQVNEKETWLKYWWLGVSFHICAQYVPVALGLKVVETVWVNESSIVIVCGLVVAPLLNTQL